LLGSASILPATITHQHLTPWLSSVYVPEAHRGKGIASALSRRAASEAGKLGFDRLYLFTPRSEALYARLGWSDRLQRRSADSDGKTGRRGVLNCLN